MSPFYTAPLSPATTAKILSGRNQQGHLTGGHTVLIYALTTATQLTALLGPSGGRITGGYGKWEEVAVPRGIPFTQWTGRSLTQMDLELFIDRWASAQSVEGDIMRLETLAIRPGVAPGVTPPPVRLVGAVPHPDFTWVITGIDWGDCLRDSATGARLRQAAVVHLLEYMEERVVSALPPPPRKYKVKRGDDLKKIAARMLGKSARWPEIVKLNKGLRGWRLTAKQIGKTILVPAK